MKERSVSTEFIQDIPAHSDSPLRTEVSTSQLQIMISSEPRFNEISYWHNPRVPHTPFSSGKGWVSGDKREPEHVTAPSPILRLHGYPRDKPFLNLDWKWMPVYSRCEVECGREGQERDCNVWLWVIVEIALILNERHLKLVGDLLDIKQLEKKKTHFIRREWPLGRVRYIPCNHIDDRRCKCSMFLC